MYKNLQLITSPPSNSITEVTLKQVGNITSKVADGFVGTGLTVKSNSKVEEVVDGRQIWTKGKEEDGFFTLTSGNKFLTAVSTDQLMMEGMII